MPSRKNLNILKGKGDQQVNSDSDEEETQFDEVQFALRDRGERFACIIQRIILSPKKN